jgi:uncharacterized protein (TIGR00369 family)
MKNSIDRNHALEYLDRLCSDTLMQTLGIRYTDAGANFLEATMPVDSRHHQPMGILHGGATAALAESVASAASGLELHGTSRHAVGLELSINHIRSVREGTITARASALHIGGSTHVWEIRVTGQDGRLLAHAKQIMLVMSRGAKDSD